jgi:hypothetical protein
MRTFAEYISEEGQFLEGPGYHQLVDPVSVAQIAGDLRALINMWKDSKSLARTGDENGIIQMKKIQRAMQKVAPEWYAAQIAKSRARASNKEIA